MSVTATRALLWEYYRLARRPVGVLVLSSCSLAALYRMALDGLGARRDGVVFTSVFVTLCIVYLLTLLTCRADGMTLGFERRLYRLPLGTGALVMARWAPALLATALSYTITVVFMRWAFRAQWPLLGPLLILCTVVGTGLSLSWSLGTRPYLLAPVGLPVFGLLFHWLRPFLRMEAERNLTAWEDFGSTEVSALLAVLASGALAAVVGVARDRSGRKGRRSRDAGSSSRTDRSVSGSRRFRDARDAQLFVEWREKGRWLPVVCVASLASAVVAGSFPSFETGLILRHALLAFGLALVALPPVSGFLHGWFDLKGPLASMDRVRATRPLTDRALADLLRLAALRAVLAGWLAAAVALALVLLTTGLLGDSGKTLLVLDGIVQAMAHVHPVDLALFFAVVASWAAASSGLMLALVASGNPSIITAFAVGPYAWVLLGLLAERIAGVDFLLEVLPWGAIALVVLLPLATVGAMASCWRRGHYDARGLLRAALPYVALNALLLFRSPFLQRAFDADEMWVGRGAALLVPAALSALLLPRFLAPLTLGANRHR